MMIFPLSHYFDLDNYKEFCETLKDIDSIVTTADPFVDLLELHELIRDQLVLSSTTKGLNYWQQMYEI